MTSDDQHFLDLITAVPHDIHRYTNEITDAIEAHFNFVAGVLRENFGLDGFPDQWVPPALKRKPPPPPPKLAASLRSPRGLMGCTKHWIMGHAALVAALAVFVGTGGYLLYQRRKSYARKRRAKRTEGGLRREVVVVFGSMDSPIARSVITDLERRGFIVYVIVTNAAEEQMIAGEGRKDILPLHINATDPSDVRNTIDNFRRILTDSATYSSTIDSTLKPHDLEFAGFVAIPEVLGSPNGPVEITSTDAWSDALNGRVLHTIATTQAFLRIICDFKARLLVLTPNITPSLRLPFHGVENTSVAAIDAFTTSLAGELRLLDVPVCHLKLGMFDSSNQVGNQALQRQAQSETLGWPVHARKLYARNFVILDSHSQHGVIAGRHARRRGSPMRELNNAVFDALSQPRPRSVWRVGQGSFIFEVVGTIAPVGLVGWMMGMRKPGKEGDLALSSSISPSRSTSWETVERIN